MIVAPNRLISLLTDYGFKITFANEENKTFLRKAIQLLTKSSLEIKNIRHLSSEFEGITEEARKGFYDTVCMIDKEFYVIIEMQVGNYKHLLERLVFYMAQLYVAQIAKGKKGFTDIKKVHCICITKDAILEDETNYYHKAAFITETGKILIDKMEIILVELEKFTKLAHETENELEELLFTMKNAHTIDLEKPQDIPHFWKKEWLQDVIKELNLSTMSPINRALYNIRVAGLMAINEQYEIEKLENKMRIVEKMLKRGKLSVEEIAEDTDLSTDVILEIKKKMKKKNNV